MLAVSPQVRRRGQSSTIEVFPLSAWRSAGACGAADLDLFFVPDGVSGQERRRRETAARQICAGCPVRTECLRYAVRTRERFGIWGGMTPGERSHVEPW